MAAGLVTINFKDGDGNTRTGRFWSSDGTLSGLLHSAPVLIDGSGNVIDYTTASLVKPAGRNYETVAASQTDQAMGAAGAAGDVLDSVLIVPATTSPGAVSIKDGGGSAITIFTGGASSVSNLVPFVVPVGATSGAGAWKITTGANVSAIGVGSFT